MLKPENELPWIEEFPTPSLDSLKWEVVSGNPNLISSTSKSYPYSLQMDSTDGIASSTILLSGKNDVKLNYFYLNPRADSSNRLIVAGFDGFGWVELARHIANPAASTLFDLNEINIPEHLLTNSFQIENNQWQTAIWNRSLTSKITSLNNIAPEDTVSFYIEVSIADTVFLGDMDSLRFSISSVNNPEQNYSFQLKTSTQWKETFQTTTLDTVKWRKVRGNPVISPNASDEISPP